MTMECRDQNIPPSFNNVGQNFTFLLKRGYVAIISCFITIPLPAIAGEYFNPHLLEVNETGTTAVDLSYISQETVPPGEYNLDVYINDEFIASESIIYAKTGGKLEKMGYTVKQLDLVVTRNPPSYFFR